MIVLAVVAPIFLHYTGFNPQRRIAPLVYPKLHGYVPRLTPDQGDNHGIDFSQLWLSAQRLSAGETVYYPVSKRTWRREWSSTYHPLIHWLYVPLGKLAFKPALIVHNLFGVSLLLLCAALALRSAGCLAAFPSTTAAILASMYFTPTGLMHLERGQMDLFVGTSMLCLVAFFGSRSRGWAVAAGIVSTFKVQAWIFVGLYWIFGALLGGLRERAQWWVPATIALGSLLFLGQVLEWVPSFLYVAENTSRFGPSFSMILPKSMMFAIPLLTLAAIGLVSFLSLRKREGLADVAARRTLLERLSFPVAAALAVQTICATPVTHDYRLVALLGLLPALAVWCVRAESVSPRLQQAVSYGYAAMLLVALRVRPFTELSYPAMASTLLVFSLLFAGVAVYLALGAGPASGRREASDAERMRPLTAAAPAGGAST